ncbi:M23 family metallopeptidase [Myxacorys almedinensis]|uniref:Peptidoglycan DD-metalloendopeptidase family protein n=1 Tax=Myxacorys almedinensis A TaxID=2690445 RepID=A0A8J7Z663_9CYAN|nr:M23 family metallopeptidase [Myxacorys almedinensis]NDJ18626.1 peptidoglycan DD-metalloendopeptidase family protein [Myxacorys almedinensis A]
MTQQSNSPAKAMCSRKALIKRLGCLSSLSVFSSGVALAQVPSPAVSVAPVPVASPIASPAASLPTDAPVVSVQAKPPVVVNVKPNPAAIIIAPPETAVVEQASPSPAPDAATEAPAIAPITPETAPDLIGQPPMSNGYEAPDAVVFSERASGCEFSVQAGQVSGCGAPAKPPVARTKPSGIANTISKVISGVVRPTFAEATAPASLEAASAQTGSDGSPSGAAWNGSNTAIGSAYSTVQSYYNRTIRPLGMPGNGNVRLLYPLSLPAAITSFFGWRIHPISGAHRIHTGTDLGAPMGTPVLAALAGRVIMSGWMGGYGVAIGLEHTDGTQQTLYAHLSEVFVKPGDIVPQGTAIGRVGSTGNSTGPHLHFEFRQQTQDGTWIAQDAGFALEQSMAQLAKSLQVSQLQPTQKTAAN